MLLEGRGSRGAADLMAFAPEHIHADTWPPIFAVLRPAMLRAGYTSTELIDDLLSGDAQLWVLRKGGDPIAAAVSQLVIEPEGKIVKGHLLANPHGLRGAVEDAIACVTDHAKAMGAVGIEVTGRPGWLRRLKSKGWRQKAVTMRLDLVPEGVA
jgi:hypothetical protein